MNVFPLIVPCCFAMWQEAEPSLVARWVVAAVQTAPCAHSALNGLWNQSHLAAIMPLNIQHGLPACAGDYQGIVSSVLVLSFEEYLVSLCWNNNTHTQMPGASSQSSAVFIPGVLILQKLILKHLKKKQMLQPQSLLSAFSFILMQLMLHDHIIHPSFELFIFCYSICPDVLLPSHDFQDVPRPDGI